MNGGGRDGGRIGQFKIGNDIGDGSFGVVKLGTHILTQEKVAIKVLEKAKIVQSEDVLRVRREIKILKNLRHPNIIQLYEIIEDKENIYLIMEYASRGELFNYIVEKGRLDEIEACRLYQQIVRAMEYFHKLNIAHRDIKPENLFLDDQLNIKVGDFGLSNQFGSDFLLNTSCGSPCYAAPEMISGKPYSGITVDIWASGVVLFAMLCGYLPFNYPEDQTATLFREIRKGNYKIPSLVNREARDLIKGILTVDYRQRLTVAGIMAHPWFRFHEAYRYKFPGVMVGLQGIPVDQYILSKVQQYGLDMEGVKKDLLDNKHNSNTSLYYLLLIAEKRRGYYTPYDIASAEFEPQNLLGSPAITSTRASVSLRKPVALYPQNSVVPAHKQENALSTAREDATKNYSTSGHYSDRGNSYRTHSSPGSPQLSERTSNQPHQYAYTDRPTPLVANPAYPMAYPSTQYQVPQVSEQPYISPQAIPRRVEPPQENYSQVSQKQPSSSVSKKINPNIYNKIEINYITNNYGQQVDNGSPIQETATEMDSNTTRTVSNLKHVETSIGIQQITEQGNQEAFSLIAKNQQELKSKEQTPKKPRSPIEVIVKNEYMSSSIDVAIKSNNEKPQEPVKVTKTSALKDEAQYRSLVELSSNGKSSTVRVESSNKQTKTRRIRNFGSLLEPSKGGSGPIHHTNTKSKGSQVQGMMGHKKSVDHTTGLLKKLGIKDSKFKHTLHKLDSGNQSRSTIGKSGIGKDSQTKLAKKITNIFQNINKKVSKASGYLTSRQSTTGMSQISTHSSTDKKTGIKNPTSALLHKIKDKKSGRNSIINFEESTSNRGRSTSTISNPSTTYSHIKSVMADFRGHGKPEVSLYQKPSKKSSVRTSSQKSTDFDHLYTSSRLSAPKKSIVSSDSTLQPSTLDRKKGIYVSARPLNLSAISLKPPQELSAQIAEALSVVWASEVETYSKAEHFGHRASIRGLNLLIRVEEVEGGTGLHTICVYPMGLCNYSKLSQISGQLFASLTL